MCVQMMNTLIQKMSVVLRWSGRQVFTRDLDFLVKYRLSV